MSLKAFHVLFITASVVLAIGVGVRFLRNGGAYAAAGAVCLAVGAALIAYEIWFIRKARRLP